MIRAWKDYETLLMEMSLLDQRECIEQAFLGLEALGVV